MCVGSVCADGTLKLTVSEEWTDAINWFFACYYRFTKNKIWSKNILLGMGQKKGVVSLITRLYKWLRQKNKKMEWIDFLHADTNSGTLKVDSMIFGWVF